MKKLAMFPFSNDVKIIIEYLDRIKGFTITDILGIKEEYQYIQRNELIKEINVSIDYKRVIEQIDAILFCDNINNYDLKGYRERMKYAMLQQKEIYLSTILYHQIGEEFFGDYSVNLLNKDWNKNEYQSENIFEINVPVVSVLGWGENTDKFALQLKIIQKIEEMGYKVLGITSNPLGALFGLNTLPEYLYSEKKAFFRKIIDFNHDMYKKIQEENPDIVVIGVPSGIMPINKYCHNYFGEITHVISKAIPCDSSIINMYYMSKVSSEMCTEIVKYCDMNFGVYIQGLCVSRQSCNFDYERKCMEYQFVDERTIRKDFIRGEGMDTPIFLYQDEVCLTNIINNMLHKFTENISIL